MNDLMVDYNDDNRIINMGADESHNELFYLVIHNLQVACKCDRI